MAQSNNHLSSTQSFWDGSSDGEQLSSPSAGLSPRSTCLRSHCWSGRWLCFQGVAVLVGGGGDLLFSRPAPGYSHGGSYRVPKAPRESSPVCRLFTSLCSHQATTVSFCQRNLWPIWIPRKGKQTPAMVGGAAECCGYCFSIYVATLRFWVFEKEIDLEVQAFLSPICNRLSHTFLILSNSEYREKRRDQKCVYKACTRW